VVLSEGTFTIAVSINIKSNVYLEGQGLATVLFLAANADCAVILPSAARTYCTVSRLRIDGNKANQTNTANTHGIHFASVTGGRIEDVYVVSCKKHGIVLQSSSGCVVAHNTSNSNDGSSIFLTGSSNNRIIGNHCESNTQDGLGMQSASNNCIIEGNAFLSNLYDGFAHTGNIGTVVKGNECISNTLSGLAFNLDSRNCLVVGNISGGNGHSGIYLGGSYRNTVCGNNIYNNSVGNSDTYSGIHLAAITGTNSTRNIIIGNHINDTQGTPTQKYGYNEADSSQNYNTIIGNHTQGNVSSHMNVQGANDIVRDNLGYVTENSGTATVANGQTTVTVTHGLATTPTRVQVTPTLLSNAASFWVTAKGATTFVINVNADPGAGTATFDWRAVVGEGN